MKLAPVHHAKFRAVFSEDNDVCVEHYGSWEGEYQAAWNGAAVHDLAPGIIELQGPDARSFLHNLTTNDIRNLPVGGGCELFLTTHKAKFIAHGVATCLRSGRDELFWLEVEAGLAERTFAHLDRHLISEQVEISNRTNEVGVLRVLGPDSERLVADVAGTDVRVGLAWRLVSSHGSSERAWQVRRQAALTPTGFDVLANASDLVELWEGLVERGARPAGRRAFDVIRMESGWPAAGSELDENRFVVETGRIAQAISYAKGCYLGQEPIVMARDRGQVNRQLRGLRISGTEPVAHGVRLLRGEEEAGQVTSSAWSPGLGSLIGLAYLKRGHQDEGGELSLPGDDRKATVCSLPMVAF